MKAFYLFAALTFAVTPVDPVRAAADVMPKPTTAAAAENSVEQAIEQLHAALRSTKKPLPAWAADFALRGYTAYRTYKNGERVEAIEKELQLTTLGVLQEVASIKAIIEAGRDLTQTEYRRFRERLDGYGHRLDTHEAMIRALQQQQDEFRKEIEAHARQAQILRKKVEYRICGAEQVNDGRGNCVRWDGHRRQH